MTDDPNKKKLANFKNKWKTVWEYRVEIFSGILVLVGLVLAFFYIRIGGALVGLGFGICFFEEMHQYFIQLRDIYVEHGIFKTLILVGTILFFLIAIPVFIIAAAVGYGAMYLLSFLKK